MNKLTDNDLTNSQPPQDDKTKKNTTSNTGKNANANAGTSN